MLNRRDLLKTAAFAGFGKWSGGLRGIFPTLLIPLTSGNRLDSYALARQVEFIGRRGAHGVVWPGNALGAEIVMETAKGPVILCVQGADLRSTRRYARHADKLRPAAVMATPMGDLAILAEHYRAIAGECSLPLVAHVAGDMSVEFVLRMRNEIPTLRFVKDEAGHILSRISEYQRAAPELAVFTGGRGRTMPDELERGSSGAMPPARFTRAYVRIWNDCLAGRREKAIADLTLLHCATSG